LVPREAFPFYERPIFLVGAALFLRLAALWFAWRHGFPDQYGRYGFETGSVAASIARGKGFSSPSHVLETGPTAWVLPLYPYLVAGVFKIWGVFTVKSHVILQIINCVFSAFVVLPIGAIAKRIFGRPVAAAACWVWVILPTASHMPIRYVWETALSALMLSVLLWSTLELRGKTNLTFWGGYGALWATALMVNASFTSMIPFFFIWLAREIHKRGLPWLSRVGITSVILALGVMPWTIRNYRTFHKHVFLRTGFGEMLWNGNNPVDSTQDPFALSPFRYPPAAADFARLGEVQFMELRKMEAIDFMRSHPFHTAYLIQRRAWFYWFSVTDGSSRTRSGGLPLYLKLYGIANGVMVLFSWYGLGLFVRSREPESIPFLVVLVCYPLVYYLTVTTIRYRFPMEPIIVILAVYGASQMPYWENFKQPLPPSLQPDF
jgi:4-amino-4-deoxy-L-arabinose transferase-like glycosyltransferase